MNHSKHIVKHELVSGGRNLLYAYFLMNKNVKWGWWGRVYFLLFKESELPLQQATRS